MRRQLTIGFFCWLMAQTAMAQDLKAEFDSMQYDAFTHGEWNTVIELYNSNNTLSDFNFSHQRTGYAYFMLGRHRKAIQIFDKALVHNPTSDYSIKWRYAALVRSGQRAEAILAGSTMSPKVAALVKVVKPRLLRSVAVGGGYRISDNIKYVSSSPMFWLMLGHELGSRINLRHGISYIVQNRYYGSVSQVAYFMQADVTLSRRITGGIVYSPAFWSTGNNVSGVDHTMGAHARLRAGAFDLDLFGGAQLLAADSANDGSIGLSATWYPFGNLKYSLTGTYAHQFSGGGAGPSARITASALLVRGLWLIPTFTFGNERVAAEAGRFEPSNNSLDRLRNRISATLLYSPKGTWGASITYTREARIESRTLNPINYNCIYAAFTYNFN